MNINTLPHPPSSPEGVYLNTDHLSVEQDFQLSEVESDISHTPRISIVVPVYNAGEYLRPCLDTLLNQTFRDIEIVCVLDCPTDGSDRVVEEYAAKDDRIVVIRNKHNLNIGETRNVGMRAAKGEYIGFSDHDDTRELDMYEKMYAATEHSQKKVVFSGKIVNLVLNNEISKFLHNNDLCFYPIYQLTFFTIMTRFIGEKFIGRGHVTPNLYQRDYLRKYDITFVDTKQCYAEDSLFNLSVLSHIQSDSEISNLQEVFYRFIVHGNNAHLSSWYSDYPHIIQHMHEMSVIIDSISWKDNNIELLKELLFVSMISFSYSWFIHNIKKEGLIRSYRLLKEYINSDIVCRKIVCDTKAPQFGLSVSKRMFAFWLRQVL